MPLWGNADNAANSTIYTASQFNKAPDTANQSALFGNTTADFFVTGETIGVYGVDAQEMAAAQTAPQHAGWVIRHEGSGGRAGRVWFETLVAMGSMTEDSEDSAFVDYRLVITTQPTSNTQVTGNVVTFSVVAESIPSGATIRYQWQVDGGPAVATWSNIANAGIYASSSGNTTATLRISDNATVNNNVYRVLVSTDGATQVISGNATVNVL